MLIDAATANLALYPDSIPDLALEGEPVKKTVVVADFWEEHCVECGAPACYGTCGKFQKANDGRCRRFVQGILPVKDNQGHAAVAIQFRSWGKLELFFRGRMILPETELRIARVQRIMERVSRLINPFFSWLPYARNPIAVWRAVRRRWTGRIEGVSQSPNQWVIQAIVERPVDLVASILNENKEEIFVRRLTLAVGCNSFLFEVPAVVAGSCFRIFSIEGSSVPVYFTRLELVYGERSMTQNETSSAEFVKCVAWDLDNTLWNGILAEDGPDGIVLRQEAIELIRLLDSRGILNTVCSKNDWGPVRAALEKFGILEYFVFPEVNWGPKSESISRAAKNINIGVNSFAFIDDSPYERGEVHAHCPSVRIYSEVDLKRIGCEDCFNPPISAESALRRKSYLIEMERRMAEVQSGGARIDFLKDCQIQLTCGRVASEQLRKRCWELVNRTNQLTLAAHRYTEDEFAHLIGNTEAYAIHCRDKYGDYGVVGFIAVKVSNGVADVHEFVMSCRVAKKFCEQSVLLFLADRCRNMSCQTMSASVVVTGRNGALIEAFDQMPFAKKSITDRAMEYSLSLDTRSWRDVFCHSVTIGDVYL